MPLDWIEHSATLVLVCMGVISTLLSIIGILLIRALNANSKTLTNFREDLKTLFGRVERNEKDIAYLRGQHEARTGLKLKCSVEESG